MVNCAAVARKRIKKATQWRVAFVYFYHRHPKKAVIQWAMTRKIALTLSALISLIILSSLLFGASSNPQVASVAGSPPPTVSPTSTPVPFGVILTGRQTLVRHFDHKYNLMSWTELSYGNGAYQVTAQSFSGRARLQIETVGPDDVSQIYYYFRYNDQVFSREWERQSGMGVMLDIVRFTFPQWPGGAAWVRENVEREQSKRVIDGVSLYLQHGKETATGDDIIILAVTEEK